MAKKKKAEEVVAGSVAPAPVEEKETRRPKVDGELQAAWAAFLEKAEAQAEENGTLHIFNAQKERGEFDTIPRSFTVNHGIRVAPK